MLTEENTKAALGGSSIYLVYAYAVYRAVYTCVILDCNS